MGKSIFCKMDLNILMRICIFSKLYTVKTDVLWRPSAIHIVKTMVFSRFGVGNRIFLNIAALGASWLAFWCFGDVLVTLLGALGLSWGALGVLWDTLGIFLGALGAFLGTLRPYLSSKKKFNKVWARIWEDLKEFPQGWRRVPKEMRNNWRNSKEFWTESK